VRNNEGSGIVCVVTDPTITDVKIFENQSKEDGGGLLSQYSSPKLDNVLIRDNVALCGGGIFNFPNLGELLYLSNVTICENKAGYGGGIYDSDGGSLSFDQVNRCNIYLNHADTAGHDLYVPGQDFEHTFVTLDTFTVKTPTKEYVYPLNAFSFDILHWILTTDISNDNNHLPSRFHLYRNFPNPFNPRTTISFDIPHTAHVQLTIYDILGRQVRRLIDTQPAGQHKITWDATDNYGQHVAAGLYFCRMEAGDYIKVIKLALVK
jgi:hypothetical protein